jgi:hypothetical protein
MQKWLFLPIVMDIDSRARVFLETTVAHKFSLTWDVYPKLELLITGATPMAANLWYTGPSRLFAPFILAVVVGGLTAVALRLARRGDKESRRAQVAWSCFKSLVGLLIVWIAVNATFILPAEGHLTHRVLFPYSAFIVLIFAWALWQLACFTCGERSGRVFTIAIGGMAIAAAVLAEHNVSTTCTNDVLELAYVRSRLLSAVDRQPPIEKIHGIQPRTGYTFLGDDTRASPDLNMKATVPGLFAPFVRFAGLSLGLNLRPVTITQSGQIKPVAWNEDTLVIDMTLLQGPMRK